MRKRQCAKCPWKVSTDPREIPNGYDVEKHRALAGTIRSGPESLGGDLHLMACHESDDEPCLGWLANQLGPGNNLGLRLAVATGRLKGVSFDFELEGEQHTTFEETLP